MNNRTAFVELNEYPKPTLGWVLISADEQSRLEVLANGHHMDVTIELLAKELEHIHKSHGCNRFVLDAPRGWADAIRHWMRGLYPSVEFLEVKP